MKYQAPLFHGSSCTHTRSVPSVYGLRRLDHVLRLQRVELLEAHDRDVVDLGALARREQVVVDLARAQEHPPRLLRVDGARPG